MNDGLKKWFSTKTKKELIAMCYELHCANMELQGYKVVSGRFEKGEEE